MGKPQGNKKAMKPTANAKAIKEGQVKKNKQTKFKQTPAGKVPIINGKANGNGQQKQIPSPVQAQKKSAKIKQQGKKSPLSASPQQKKSPLSASPQQKKNQKKPKQQKNAMIKKEIKEEVNDSDADLNESDINEGISIPEDVSMEGEDSNDSSSDGETPDIFGKSLADDSDDDDEDFDDDEEEETNKGIKMFKGISVKSETKETDDDDDDEEEDDSDDLNESDVSSIEDDSEDEDEDEDEEEDDDDDEAENELGLKALLGDSLVDDENDEDFEGDDDDDDEDDDSEADESMEINEEKTSPTKEKNGSIVMLSEEEKAEQDKRTIFIGNVPIAVEEAKLKNTFKVFGPIESIRIRGIIPDSPKTPLKVAAIKKKFHPKATAKCAFIIYKSEESVPKALSLNGEQLEGNYLRVDRANAERVMDPKKAIFLGNLPFDLEDNDLWECFKACGKVDWVRTVRDRMTGCVRGIGYINFKNEDSVALALELNGTKLRNRAIRVDRYKAPTEKKPKKSIGKKRSFSGDAQNSKSKKAKNEIETATANSQNAERRKQLKGKRSQGEQKRRQGSNNDAFQGQRANNKKPFNKGNNKMQKKKQNMSAKLTSKPNKPQ